MKWLIKKFIDYWTLEKARRRAVQRLLRVNIDTVINSPSMYEYSLSGEWQALMWMSGLVHGDHNKLPIQQLRTMTLTLTDPDVNASWVCDYMLTLEEIL